MRPFNRCYSSSFLPTPFQSSCRLLRFALWVCFISVLPAMLMPLAFCGTSALNSQTRQDSSPSGFRMESLAFAQGKRIPQRFTCEGADISPELKWSAPPAGTRSLVLIVEDPDAPGGIWTHWVAYNLPARAREIPESVPKQERLAGGGLQGLNSFGRIGYGGPCPPPGNAHRYFFRLYALDITLSLKPGASRQEVLAASKGHVLGEAHLMGRFKR